LIKNTSELVVETAQHLSSALEAELWQLGAVGLWVEDDETRNAAAPQGLSQRSLIRAFFENVDADERKRVENQLRKVVAANTSDLLSCRWVDFIDQDWVKRFQKEWVPFSPADHVWIVPSWEQEKFQAPDKNDIVIYMDPGMAFGTGHHETTALCARGIARFMRENVKRNLRILDVGTGTGLLAMLALKMGATGARGTDIDLEALEVANENARKNGLESELKLDDAAPDQDGPVFDLVVANILSDPLIAMAKAIALSLAPRGTLMLSGILSSQEPGVRSAYEREGLTWKQTLTEKEWVLIEFERRS